MASQSSSATGPARTTDDFINNLVESILTLAEAGQRDEIERRLLSMRAETYRAVMSALVATILVRSASTMINFMSPPQG